MRSQLILLGAPGSGKGTQANLLVSQLGYAHLSTGDLLRKEISSGSDLGHRVAKIMEDGRLVDDNTVLELLAKNTDLETGYAIFDGFPRNVKQAKDLDTVVLKDAESIAVYLDVGFDELAERIVNRRTCKGCGAIYNLVTSAPRIEGVCDSCGSKDLVQRKDDNYETVKNRLDIFQKEIGPILDYYEEQGRLKRIEASTGLDEVFEKLKSVVN